MKQNCEVIMDLLPLYHDGVCSEGSRRLVEEHLKECERCSQALEEIKKELSAPNTTLKDAGKAWRSLTRNLLIRRITAVVLVAALMISAIYGGQWLYRWDQEQLHYVEPDEIVVNNLCRLADGRIYLEIASTDGHNMMIYERSESHPPYTPEYTGSYLITGYWAKYTDSWENWKAHWVVLKPSTEWTMESGGEREQFRFTAEDIVLTDKNQTKEILVCRFDDELPPASAEIEEKVRYLESPRNG